VRSFGREKQRAAACTSPNSGHARVIRGTNGRAFRRRLSREYGNWTAKMNVTFSAKADIRADRFYVSNVADC
jgi:hypothetical protein